ncbi:MAG: lipopolysaccharide biosynthesis protein [Actinobacteria bacterium]|nr:lipopolysaccharide biosynthesis protein [Actinomycetota bacterium]
MASPEVHEVAGLTDPETNDQAQPAGNGMAPSRRAGVSRVGNIDLYARYQDLRAHLTSPLYRNAYALMINTAVTGVLGVLYWLLAARGYTAVEVGRASAAYSAMNLVSGFTAYNLIGAITRFLPQTGDRTRSWVVRTYLFSSLASIVVTIPFLLTVSHWGPTYSELTGLVPGIAFLLSVVTWSIFTLQDGVMTGLRNAIWVPLENGTFGIVKIVLLLAFAAAIPTVGIYASWMLPVFVSLPLVNGLIFFKLIPRHEELTAHRTPPTTRQIGKFLAGDYIGAMCLLGVNNLVPILVAARIGPEKSAYFYIAWSIGLVLDLLALNMAMSLTVEGAFDAQMLASNLRSALKRLAIILLPVVALVALLAPFALRLYGPAYAHYGAPVLELMALATVPKAVTELFLGAMRAQNRPRMIAIIQIVRFVLILGLALGLTGVVGVSGASLGALITQLLVAIVIFPKLQQIMSSRRAARADRAAEAEGLRPAPAAPALGTAYASGPVTTGAEPTRTDLRLDRIDLDKTMIGPLPAALREAALAGVRDAARANAGGAKEAAFARPVNEAFDNFAARTLTLPIRAIAVAMGDAALTSPLDIVAPAPPAGRLGSAGGGPGGDTGGPDGRTARRAERTPPPPRAPAPRRPKPAQPQPSSSSLFGSVPTWLPTALIAVLGAAGTALFLGTVGQATPKLGSMTGLGLISILPATSLGGLVLLALAFIFALGRARPKPLLLGALVAAIVICLDGVTTVMEPEPRFPTAYWIAGFVEYVYRTGHTSPALSAYFSWPGFFQVIAVIEHILGTDNLMPVLRYWPVAMDLLALLPMGLIVRRLHATWRAKWLALFIFTIGNWVGQDYFSPQSFMYVLYLFMLALLITYFGKRATTDGPATADAAGSGHRLSVRRLPVPGFTRRLVDRVRLDRPLPGDKPAVAASRGQRIAVASAIVAIMAFATVGHQLTPFFMVVACAALVLIGRCQLRTLPILLAVIFAAWVSFGADGFWSGHLSDMFGGLGDLGSNLSTSVAARSTGTSSLHKYVLYSRDGFAAVMLILAGLGLLRRRRLAIDDRVLVVLTCVPFLGFGLQSYGGEMALRVYLFMLPTACILAAMLFFPAPVRDWRPWRTLPMLAVAAAAAMVLFIVPRYGNEAFEQTPVGEVAATNYLYAHDSQGIHVLWTSEDPVNDVTPQIPWSYQDIEKIDYVPEKAPLNPASVGSLVAELKASGPGSYVMTTSTQEAYLVQGASYPADWGQQFRAAMKAYPGVKVAYSNATAVIWTLTWPKGTARTPLPTTLQTLPSTIWTPIGLAELALLLLVLGAREFVRIWRPASTRLMRRLGLATFPLLVAFLVIVIIRFVVLG